MKPKNKKTIGILGGMGPDATITLFHRIVANTRAKKDQDHFHVIVDSNPSIPDRTAALLEGGSSPVPLVTAAAHRLQEAGAGIIGMPCNTAHAFFLEITREIKIPFVNMVELAQGEADRFAKKTGSACHLFATRGTVNTGIFHGLKTPPEKEQERIQSLIYDVKAGAVLKDKQQDLLEIIDDLGVKDCGVVLGCTELSFLFWPPYNPPIKHEAANIIDPLDLLARELIRKAGSA